MNILENKRLSISSIIPDQTSDYFANPEIKVTKAENIPEVKIDTVNSGMDSE